MDIPMQTRQVPALDEYGLLLHPEQWDEPTAQCIARQVGIPELTRDHWVVIEALRSHYQKFGVAPTMHNVCRSLGHPSNWVHQLFHTCMDAWRVAGLPDPGEEAKSYMSDM